MASLQSSSSEKGVIGFLKTVFSGIVSVLFVLSIIGVIIAVIAVLIINSNNYSWHISAGLIVLGGIVAILLVIMAFGLISLVIAIEHNTLDTTMCAADINRRVSHLENLAQNTSDRIANIEAKLSSIAEKLPSSN